MLKFPKFLEDSLPTTEAKWVAATSWLIAMLLLFLPEFLPKTGLPPLGQEMLWPRLFAVATTLFLGSSICLALVVRHYTSAPTQKQTLITETRLEEIQEKILSFLSSNPKKNARQVAKEIGVSESLAEYHLQKLSSSRHITNQLTIGQPVVWLIDQDGRDHLVKNNFPI